MKNNSFVYYRAQLSKWLLAAALFLNFSGYAGNPILPRQQTTQTELFFSSNGKATKRTISFTKALIPACKSNNYYNNYKNEANAVLIYNRATKVRLDNISNRSYFIKIADRFIQIKIIPAGVDDDIFTSTIG
jgi:hypothetical protein